MIGYKILTWFRIRHWFSAMKPIPPKILHHFVPHLFAKNDWKHATNWTRCSVSPPRPNCAVENNRRKRRRRQNRWMKNWNHSRKSWPRQRKNVISRKNLLNSRWNLGQYWPIRMDWPNLPTHHLFLPIMMVQHFGVSCPAYIFFLHML